MDIRNLFFIGISGYLLLCVYDWAQILQKPILKHICSTGFILTGIPYISILHNSLIISQVSHIMFLLFICLLAILLIYSAMLEIPLYMKKHPTAQSGCYQRGTYSLCRHPGFIWYTIINISMIWYAREPAVTVMMILFTFCNLVLVILEDLLFFPRMFPDYADYRKRVPFLIPSPFSIKHL